MARSYSSRMQGRDWYVLPPKASILKASVSSIIPLPTLFPLPLSYPETSSYTAHLCRSVMPHHSGLLYSQTIWQWQSAPGQESMY